MNHRKAVYSSAHNFFLIHTDIQTLWYLEAGCALPENMNRTMTIILRGSLIFFNI